ncbi:hypothetical protein ABK040_014088 [Willaertia magna]
MNSDKDSNNKLTVKLDNNGDDDEEKNKKNQQELNNYLEKVVGLGIKRNNNNPNSNNNNNNNAFLPPNITPPSKYMLFANTVVPLFMRHPFERVLTIMQVQHVSPYQRIKEIITATTTSTTNPESISTELTVQKTYRNSLQVFGSISKEQGFLSYWRGFIPSFLITGSGFSIALATTDFMRSKWNEASSIARDDSRDKEERIKALQRFSGSSILTTSIISVSAILATYPLLLAKIHLEADVQRNRSFKLTELFKAIKLTEGPLGFYRGLTLSISHNLVGASTTFLLYNYIASRQARILNEGVPMDDQQRLKLQIISGTVASVGGASLSYPLEVIRNRLILQVGLGEEKLFKNGRQAFAYTLQKEGFKGLYRGFPYYLIYYTVISSTVLSVYNTFKSALALNSNTL